VKSDIAYVEIEDERGRLVINEEKRSDLSAHGYQGAADFLMQREGITLLRDRDGRRNLVLEAGGERYFLKVHREKTHRTPTEGEKEWNNTLSLRRIGVPTPLPAAWGEFGEESFFMSCDEGGAPLDDALRDASLLTPSLRRDLARQAGRLVSLFHRAGFCHHDLYLCHLLLREDRLFLIDLQRVEKKSFFKRHGLVKDLAALLYSSLQAGATAADRIRFYHAYRGAANLSPPDRRLIRAVEKKAGKIARHDARSQS